jgi:hypothetical protein
MTIAHDVMTPEQRRSVALEYFTRLDARDFDALARLFAGDAQLCLPGQGAARGIDAVTAALPDAAPAEAMHESAYFTFVAAEDTLVVEGTTSTGGRFCAVFEVRDFLIERLFVYTGG